MAFLLILFHRAVLFAGQAIYDYLEPAEWHRYIG